MRIQNRIRTFTIPTADCNFDMRSFSFKSRQALLMRLPFATTHSATQQLPSRLPHSVQPGPPSINPITKLALPRWPSHRLPACRKCELVSTSDSTFSSPGFRVASRKPSTRRKSKANFDVEIEHKKRLKLLRTHVWTNRPGVYYYAIIEMLADDKPFIGGAMPIVDRLMKSSQNVIETQ